MVNTCMYGYMQVTLNSRNLLASDMRVHVTAYSLWASSMHASLENLDGLSLAYISCAIRKIHATYQSCESESRRVAKYNSEHQSRSGQDQTCANGSNFRAMRESDFSAPKLLWRQPKQATAAFLTSLFCGASVRCHKVHQYGIKAHQYAIKIQMCLASTATHTSVSDAFLFCRRHV
jgi:hypothetical protein